MLHSLRVADYMATKLVTLTPDTSIDQAIRELLTHRISGAPVIEGDELVGMFSESDCLEEALQSGYHNMSSGSVKDVMSTQVVFVSPEDSILQVAEMFIKKGRHRLPVKDHNGKLVGQISRRDVIRAMDDITHSATAEA